jgi:hypothetical protein
MKRFTVGLVCLCTLLALTGVSQARNILPPDTEMCVTLDGFCDVLTFKVDAETGLIEGFDNNCDFGNAFLVSGQFFNYPFRVDMQQPWIIFLDYSPGVQDDMQNDNFQYGVITGQGDSGLLQRYWPDGSRFDGDPTAVTLRSCDDLTRGMPTSRAE